MRRVMRQRADRAFYRSQTVRIAFLLSGLFIAWALSPLAPYALHDTPSLLLLHRFVPWWCLSAPFLVYTGLLVWGTVAAAIVADALGMALYLIEFGALLSATITDIHVVNPLVFVCFALTVVLHYAALRLALIDWTRTEAGLK